jgi:hypothetical protein
MLLLGVEEVEAVENASVVVVVAVAVGDVTSSEGPSSSSSC